MCGSEMAALGEFFSPACLWDFARRGVSEWPLIEFMFAWSFITRSEECRRGCKSTPSFTLEESKGVEYKSLYITAGQIESEARLPSAMLLHMEMKPKHIHPEGSVKNKTSPSAEGHAWLLEQAPCVVIAGSILCLLILLLVLCMASMRMLSKQTPCWAFLQISWVY